VFDSLWAEAGKEGGSMEFEARCAEFAAGNVVPAEALCAEFKAGKEGGGMLSVPSVSVNDGTAFCVEGRARGVVGEEGFLNVGGGGGGMAARSASSFFGGVTGDSSFETVGISFSASRLVSSDVAIVGGDFSIDAGESTF
jgi:hypothetical protein